MQPYLEQLARRIRKVCRGRQYKLIFINRKTPIMRQQQGRLAFLRSGSLGDWAASSNCSPSLFNLIPMIAAPNNRPAFTGLVVILCSVPDENRKVGAIILKNRCDGRFTLSLKYHPSLPENGKSFFVFLMVAISMELEEFNHFIK